MIAHDLALALDGVAFARAAGVEPDAWQARLLRSTKQQMILNCSRQAGKSTVSSLLALHTALYQPGALVLVLAPAQRQSQELHRTIKLLFAQLGQPLPIDEESSLRLTFANGSRIIALPGKEQTIRGFAGVSLLVVDEASRTPDELYHAIRPMLAVSQGRIILLSTPFGKRGFFYHEWTEGGSDWARVFVPAPEVPRIPAAFLERERQSMPDVWFRQEYLCAFTDTVDQVFSTALIHAALSDDVTTLF